MASAFRRWLISSKANTPPKRKRPRRERLIDYFPDSCTL
jgi:hypothetical protein